MPQRPARQDIVGNTQFQLFQQGWTLPVPDDDVPSCDGSEGQATGTTCVAGGPQQQFFSIHSDTAPTATETNLDHHLPSVHGSGCLKLSGGAADSTQTTYDSLGRVPTMSANEYASTTDLILQNLLHDCGGP